MALSHARSVADIIPKLLEVIPETENNLILELTKYYDTLWNKAPELLRESESWCRLGYIMNKNITIFDSDWKKRALNIFTSTPLST
jgi:hypothetical protein